MAEKNRTRAIPNCIQNIARKLGNTPAIARASYIDPRIITMFMDGDVLGKVWSTLSSMKQQKGSSFLSPEELCVLRVLEQ